MNKYKTLGLLASWNLIYDDGQYYTLNTHYSYIEYVSTLYDKIYLVSSVRYAKASETDKNYCVSKYKNIEIVPLPEVKSSLQALKLFSQYRSAVKRVIPKVEVFYSRTPDPFSWMPVLYGHPRTIMHFVGDIIEAAHMNVKWGKMKKMLMIGGYMPEWYLTLKAAKKSICYSNGHHIVERLAKHGVKAEGVVSSTVKQDALPKKLHDLPVESGRLHLMFLSYISYHKGIDCMMRVIRNLRERGVNFVFNIAGSGDMLPQLKDFVMEEQLQDYVIIHGHMNDRNKINELFNQSDLFFFPSLSEGSPRVTIEAMSQGVPLVATPVGSLPYCFTDKENIRFFDFNDSDRATDIICEYMDNPTSFIAQRDAAFNEVKENYTKEKFLSRVFVYDA
jgi:glycosyltransferase involved in cell wall biosynthesis